MRYLCYLLSLLLFCTSCHTSRRLARRHDAERPKHATPHNTSSAKYTPEAYIATYKNIAIAQMRKYGIPASIILAQAILESGNGNSEVARNANNHFGIKCTKDWPGKTYYESTNNACFRSYPDVEASYRDHIEFLKRARYAALFDLGSTDYKRWAKGLKKAGYATNPKYASLLIGIIDKYYLHEYDER